ncbi:MAG: pyrroloquinoline quinone-dependent dehydrogenase [Sphingomonadaceae bacterium]|nr:pyrroloquinoline quinone-dependent dehydrogenase [Sphingomonadaceae bacterium]
MIWWVLGWDDALTIEGRALAVSEAPAELGQGWPAYGGDAGGNRYAAADQITPGNVNDLEIAWTHRSGTLEGRSEEALSRTAFQTTPILVEDSLFFCTQFNEVIAVDPGSGEEKWRHDPEVPTDGRPGNQFTCRGVSHWLDSAAGPEASCAARIFMGTVDARLIALDARTGEPCDDFGDGGAVRVEPNMSLRWPGEWQITSAPVIVGDVVIVGTSISDNLRTEAPEGTVHAYDARTGEEAWSFNPVPRDPDDPARATWAGNSADRVGHANVWSSMSVDRERGLVFLPTSSASPDYFGGHRGGDNRYANSVVALNGETGEVVWHFQTVHHDVWDYDLPAQPNLVQVWRDGEAHDVVVQVTKTGLVFVLDRATGTPFLPIEERAVPQGGVEGELLSPTQPFPLNTPPVVPSRHTAWSAFGITLWDRLACAAQFRALRNDGLFTPPTTEGTLAYPFSGGGANWGGAAFDPARNLLVINMSNAAAALHLIPNAENEPEADSISEAAEYAPMEGVPYGMTRELMVSPLGLPCTAPPWGILAGIDLASGDIVWRRPLGTTEDLAPGGLALGFGTPNFGGPVVTASGLVFIGAAMDDYLRAFDVETGEELWKARLPAGGQATPMSYEWQGRQYVVIAAGGHSRVGTRTGDHLVAFALPR